ncbi:hypothetical protein Tco_0465499 [Tanacetum coccineum]
MGLLKTNPGSTVKLDIEDVLGAKTYFKSYGAIYVDVAMKDGWTEGCRKVIGLDLERDYQGRVGLKEAVREWLPLAEHRQCARHIYANLKKSWPGLHFKSLFWGAASATLKHVFDEKMRLLSNLNDHAHKWLVERDPNTWSRAFFQMDRSCGAFENGICESYHAAIINQRGKPIITMLEDIRIYLMQRLVIMSEKARGLTDIITPSVRKQLEKLKEYLRLWEVYPSGYREFEVRKLNAGFGVNLETHKLKKHGKTVIVVSLNLLVVGGQSMWVKTGLSSPMPPKKRVMSGRPKGKRQKHPSESGFESAASALKRMRMDATASGSGSGLSEILQMANADPANADHGNADLVNVDHANADPEEMEHVEMEEPVLCTWKNLCT